MTASFIGATKASSFFVIPLFLAINFALVDPILDNGYRPQNGQRNYMTLIKLLKLSFDP